MWNGLGLSFGRILDNSKRMKIWEFVCDLVLVWNALQKSLVKGLVPKFVERHL